MDYHQLFSRLNEKLSEENLQLHLHCVGGFVLEYYGMKATEDIDAFYESTEKVEKIIQEIGEEFHVGTSNEPWLSQAVGEVGTSLVRPACILSIRIDSSDDRPTVK